MSDTPHPPEPLAEPVGGLEARMPLEALIAGLSRPEAFGVREGSVQVVQTHISAVFLVGERAYKLKKPARLWGLLDYGTIERRRHWCEEELRLNRRLAADVYLGVEPVVRREGALYIGGAGEVIDHVVVMRRIDEAQSLGARIQRGEAGVSEVREVAVLLASFHDLERLDPARASEDAVARFAEVCRRNFEGTPVDEGPLFPPALHRGVRRRFEHRLAALRPRLEERARNGFVVDGHGDIRLEHVIWTDSGWIVMDCCEFSETLRQVDAASDLAFLSMDLHAAGRADLARELESSWARALPDPGASDVFPLYRSYRAYVRATVDFHTSRRLELEPQIRERKAERARGFLALAWTETRRGRTPPLIVLRGLSGTGKSRVACAMAPWLDAVILQSDVVRKELAGLAPTERPDATARRALYAPAMSARTYAALLVRAREAIRSGHAVLLDATYLHRGSRSEARALAGELGAPFAILELTCPEEVVRERLAAREKQGHDASDADFAVYSSQVEADEPLAPDERAVAVTHDTRRAPGAALLQLLEILDRASGEEMP